jgi:hypothetical protein
LQAAADAKAKAGEEVAKAKQLATQEKRWLSLQGQMIVQFMKYGPELLHNPKLIQPLKKHQTKH